MEKHHLYMHTAAFNRVKELMSTHIEQNKWLPVEVLSDLFGVDLSGIFGKGSLGWRPTTLAYHCAVTDLPDGKLVVVSVPKPEEIPYCRSAPTVRDHMEDLASCDRPTLKDWLVKSGIHNGIHNIVRPYEKVYMYDALTSLRSFVENNYSLYPELVEQLTEMRTLIHTLIGTGENCCDETVCEHAEAVRKTTRLDSTDAFCYAIRALLDNKHVPGVKKALDSIYGTAAYEGARLDDAFNQAEKSYTQTIAKALNVNPEEQAAENVCDDEQNALFVTIETGMFEVTPENVAAVSSFISNAGEGRDIHLRII